MDRNKINEIVIRQVEQLNDTFSDNQKIDVNEKTILFGKGSSIDSLSLVSVIVDLEMLFSDEFGLDISLTDDRAMTRKVSPFDSINTLTEYILEIVNEQS